MNSNNLYWTGNGIPSDIMKEPMENHTMNNQNAGRLFKEDVELFSFLDLYSKKEIPPIVCLCGSTKFYSEFQKQNYLETMKGNIVLSVGFYPHSANEVHGENLGCTPEQKIKLDQLHFRKIDLANEIFVLNVGGYIGESTANEIAYSILTQKPIRFLEPGNLNFSLPNHWASRFLANTLA